MYGISKFACRHACTLHKCTRCVMHTVHVQDVCYGAWGMGYGEWSMGHADVHIHA